MHILEYLVKFAMSVFIDVVVVVAVVIFEKYTFHS